MKGKRERVRKGRKGREGMRSEGGRMKKILLTYIYI